MVRLFHFLTRYIVGMQGRHPSEDNMSACALPLSISTSATQEDTLSRGAFWRLGRSKSERIVRRNAQTVNREQVDK